MNYLACRLQTTVLLIFASKVVKSYRREPPVPGSHTLCYTRWCASTLYVGTSIHTSELYPLGRLPDFWWGTLSHGNLSLSFRVFILAGHWWLTPVIPATQEAAIRRIVVRSQPGQIVREIICWKNSTQKRARGVAQGVCLVFKPQYWEKTKQNSKPVF
jgi:hypothetical protein